MGRLDSNQHVIKDGSFLFSHYFCSMHLSSRRYIECSSVSTISPLPKLLSFKLVTFSFLFILCIYYFAVCDYNKTLWFIKLKACSSIIAVCVLVGFFNQIPGMGSNHCLCLGVLICCSSFNAKLCLISTVLPLYYLIILQSGQVVTI